MKPPAALPSGVHSTPMRNQLHTCRDRHVFEEAYAGADQRAALVFTQPGVERQDSVFNGFQVSRGRACEQSLREWEEAGGCFVLARCLSALAPAGWIVPMQSTGTLFAPPVCTCPRALPHPPLPPLFCPPPSCPLPVALLR